MIIIFCDQEKNNKGERINNRFKTIAHTTFTSPTYRIILTLNKSGNLTSKIVLVNPIKINIPKSVYLKWKKNQA